MPPAATGAPRTDSGAPSDRPNTAATWPPPLLNPDTLNELPIPLQMVLVGALLPYEVAATSVRLLKNTEALLGELVFHMNALRPAVTGVSRAYAEGQFDQFFRTIGQIQQGTNAVALVWSPLTGLRDRLVPPSTPVATPPMSPYGQPGPVYAARPTVPVRPRSAGYPVHPAPEPVTIPVVPPSTIEYVGRLGGALRDQAASLPGAGWAASLPGAGWLRRDPAPEVSTEPLPVVVAQRPAVSEPAAEPAAEPAGNGPSLLGLAAPLVPGPVRRLFGG
jgi:hypothetical protein